jgi:hypothetical protein
MESVYKRWILYSISSMLIQRKWLPYLCGLYEKEYAIINYCNYSMRIQYVKYNQWNNKIILKPWGDVFGQEWLTFTTQNKTIDPIDCFIKVMKRFRIYLVIILPDWFEIECTNRHSKGASLVYRSQLKISHECWGRDNQYIAWSRAFVTR